MAPPLPIACAADDRYIPHCAAMLHSLAVSNPGAEVQVHFLHDADADPSLVDELGRFAASLGLGWRAHQVTEEQRGRFPDHPLYGRSAWYRVLLPELLVELDAVLYLDADTIVTGSLAPLLATDLAGAPVGAVTNALYPGTPLGFLAELGVRDPGGYFNSGVLLLDLARWREEAIADDVLAFVAAGPGLGEWPDQAALNATLADRRLALAPRWNVQNTVFDLPDALLPFSAAELAEAREWPAVVHFIGPHKPWHHRCKHPMRARYFEHRHQTPWPDQPIEGATALNRALRLLPIPLGYRLERRAYRTIAHVRNRGFSKK